MDIETTLIKFNRDPNFITLRERYSTKSFLEIMSVERSENRHSSFLAWLLEAKDYVVNPKDHPIVHLLDIVIECVKEQNNVQLPEGIKDVILSRSIKDVVIEEVKTEKPVKEVAVASDYKDKIKDRLDIYIKCKLTSTDTDLPIEIIVENKIDSTEGEAKNQNKYNKTTDSQEWEEYCKATQTNRYYKACYDKQKNRIFIFLTPNKQANRASNDQFINVSYQDVLNAIIEPLLSNNDIAERVKILLEEYVLSLSLPGQYSDEEKKLRPGIVLAERQQDVDAIKELLKNNNYKELVISTAKCLCNEDEIKNIRERIEKLSRDNTRMEWTSKLNDAIKSLLEFQTDEGELSPIFDLLKKFGHTYKNLFIIILKTYIDNCHDLEDVELNMIKDTYQSLLGSPKDRSKFTVKNPKGETILNKESKRSFARFLIKEYISYQKKNMGKKMVNAYKYFFVTEDYPLCIGSPKDKTRYFDKDDCEYYISNQWGITRNPQDDGKNDECFDVIFNKVFNQRLYNLDADKKYSTNPEDNEIGLEIVDGDLWKNILEGYTIVVERILK